MRPFLPAIIWAVTLVVATWPLMLQVQHHTGNRRGIAVLLSLRVPQPPEWLAAVPLMGTRATEIWQQFAAIGVRELRQG